MTKVSLEFLSKFTQKNWTDEEFEKVDVEKELTEALDKKTEAARKKGWDESASKVKKEVYKEVEEKISEKLGVTNGKIEDMLDEYIEKKPKADIKLEDIKDTDVFKNSVAKAVKKVQDELDTVKKEYSEKSQVWKSAKVNSTLETALKKLAEEKKWDLSNTAMVDILLKGLKSDYTFDVDDDGEPIVLDKNGKPVKDDLQNDLKVTDILTNVGSSIFKEVIDDKKAPENKAPKGGLKVDPFKNDVDYYDRVQKESDPEKLAAMRAQYESQFSK